MPPLPWSTGTQLLKAPTTLHHQRWAGEALEPLGSVVRSPPYPATLPLLCREALLSPPRFPAGFCEGAHSSLGGEQPELPGL